MLLSRVVQAKYRDWKADYRSRDQLPSRLSWVSFFEGVKGSKRIKGRGSRELGSAGPTSRIGMGAAEHLCFWWGSECCYRHGHSAGSLSIHGHLLVGKNFFRRAILASGIWDVFGPKPFEHPDVQAEYDRLVNYLKVENVEELRSVPSDKLAAAYQALHPGFPLAQIIDDSNIKGGFFTLGANETHDYIYNPNYANIPVIVGDVETEGIIFGALFQDRPAEPLLTNLQKRLPTSYLKEYSLDSESAPPSSTSIHQILPGLIKLSSDLPFSAPIARFCANYPGPVCSYHFDRPTQVDGLMKDIANHGVDMSYAFGGHLPHFKDEIDKEVSRKWMGFIISFVNGEEPWPARGKQGNSMVVTKDGKIGMQNEVGTRRWAAYEKQEECWNGVQEVWHDLINSRL